MNELKNCPICASDKFDLFLETKDFSVSKETFKIVKCINCDFHFTNPIPEEDRISSYYKSDDYVSHNSTKKGIINKIYHVVRWYSLRKKLRLINKYSGNKFLLDIGAGTGHFLNLASKSGWNVNGLEPDAEARKVAYNVNQIKLNDIKELDKIENNSYDVITMWHVLEHVYHLNDQLESIKRKLKDTGVLVVAVPNMSSYDAKHYGEYWAAYDLPIHLYHFTPHSIKSLMDKHGLYQIDMRPMIFDSYYVAMLSEKYKGGSLIKGVMEGLKSNWRAKNGTYSSQIYIFKKKN